MDRLQSMRVFARVIDEGGFAAAARALDMSPAVVTRLISDLEQHLGARLIHRTTRKLVLTDAGEAYLERLRHILQDIHDAEEAAAVDVRALSGVLRVLATPVLASHFLTRRIAGWHERHPRVVLDVSVDHQPQHRIEEFDITLMVVDDTYDAAVVARPLASTQTIVCASPAYLRRVGCYDEARGVGTLTEPAQLAGLAWLRGTAMPGRAGRDHGLSLWPLGGGDEVRVAPRVALQSPSMEVLFHAVREGVGFALLSRLLIASDLASGALVQLLPDWRGGQFRVFIATPTRELVPARAKAFLAYLREQLPEAIDDRRPEASAAATLPKRSRTAATLRTP